MTMDPHRAVEEMRPKTLKHSVVASGSRWIVSVIFMGLVFPVMIHRLGIRSFGLWAELTAPTGMLGLIGLGVGPAMVVLMGRAIGKARAAENDGVCESALAEAGGLAVAGLMFSAALALCAVILGWLAAPTMVHVLHVPVAQAAGGVWLFRASSFGLGCMVLGAGIGAQMEAVGRVDLSALGAAISSVANSIFLLVAVLISPSYGALAVVSVTTGVIAIVVPGALWVPSRASVLLNWFRVDRAAMRAMVRLAPSLGGASALTSAIDPLIKWSIGSSIGPLPVSAYELAMRVVSVVSGVFSSLLYPLVPHAATRIGGGELDGLTDTVTVATRSVSALGLPALGAVAAGSGPFLAVWLGSDVPGGTSTSIKIACVGYALTIVAQPAYQALQGAGRGVRVFSVQAVTLAGAAFVVLALVPMGLGAAYVGTLGFSVGVLLATPVAGAHYGLVFGRRALWRALRASPAGIGPAIAVLPWAFVVSAAGGGAWAQLGAVVCAWCLVATAVARLGILGDVGKFKFGRHSGSASR